MQTQTQYTMRRLIFVFITLFFISCGSDDHYSLKGTAFGFADGTKVFLYGIDQNNQSSVKDTLVVQNERFEGSYPKVEDTPLNFLQMEGSNGNIVFFVENENLTALVYKDSLAASHVIGGKQNELYNQYIKESNKLTQEKMTLSAAFRKAQQEQDGIMVEALREESKVLNAKELAFKRSFVVENRNSIFGLMLLSELFSKEELSGAETTEILNDLSPKMASHALATDLKNKIAISKKADIGGMAPEFEAPNPQGKIISLKETLGTYTIIDFWASWCRPCRIENPNVVRVYEKYHDKGLNIISVSLDKEGQQDRWMKAITDDKMDWYHVSNLKFWQDPIARLYNVRSIPSTFLLDSEGRIIDKNLRGPALEQRIAELLD